MKIYDYSTGIRYSIDDNLDLHELKNMSINPNEIVKISPMTCVGLSSYMDWKKSFEKVFSNIQDGIVDIEPIIEKKLNQMEKNIDDDIKSGIIIPDEIIDGVKKIRKAMLVILPKIISIYLSNGKYTLTPTIDKWLEYSYKYATHVKETNTK